MDRGRRWFGFGSVFHIEATLQGKIEQLESITLVLNASLYASLGFLGSVLALRSGRDDFSLLIPYIRFQQDSSPGRPILLDINVITDSRLYKILNTGFVDGNLIIPRFVFEDLHIMANKHAKSTSSRTKGFGCFGAFKNRGQVSDDHSRL
jgi:uncharacterized protein YacL